MLEEDIKRFYIDITKVPAKTMEAYYHKVLSEDASKFTADEKHFPGLYALTRERDALRKARAVKGQVTGPVSLGVQIVNKERMPILYQDTERELLLKTLKLKAKWQEDFLRRFNPNPMVFLDEPSMSLIGTVCVAVERNVAVSYIEEVLGGLGGMKGIHCCGNTDWSALLETSANILSFDAYDWSHTLALYSSQVESFLSRGGKLAWGIVPTLNELIEKETVGSLMARLEKGLSQFTDKGIDLDEILHSSLITPACGLGPATPANAVKALRMTRELSTLLRKKHGLEG